MPVTQLPPRMVPRSASEDYSNRGLRGLPVPPPRVSVARSTSDDYYGNAVSYILYSILYCLYLLSFLCSFSGLNTNNQRSLRKGCMHHNILSLHHHHLQQCIALHLKASMLHILMPLVKHTYTH